MSISISTLSHALRTISAGSSTPIGLGHTQQLVAAALGYKSLAAYQTAIAQGVESQHFDAVRHVVLNLQLLETRYYDLAIKVPGPQLLALLQATLERCLPSASLHLSMDKFEDVIREYIDDKVLNDESTSGELAGSNGLGLDEIYVPFEFSTVDIPPPGNMWEFELEGHVSLEIDDDRPYSGHQVNLQARLTLERIGLATFGALHCEVTRAQLDEGWDDDDNEGPKVPLAEALATEMGLSVEEAEDLVDAEFVLTESHGGTPTGYEFDFTDFAPPETAQKILNKYQSLRVQFPLSFLYQVAVPQ